MVKIRNYFFFFFSPGVLCLCLSLKSKDQNANANSGDDDENDTCIKYTVRFGVKPRTRGKRACDARTLAHKPASISEPLVPVNDFSLIYIQPFMISVCLKDYGEYYCGEANENTYILRAGSRHQTHRNYRSFLCLTRRAR